MRSFAQVDVFTATPLLGNPVAVVLDANGMSDADCEIWVGADAVTVIAGEVAL